MNRIKIEWPEMVYFQTEIPVRITDLNYGGHVGNDSVLSLMHEARVRFLSFYGYTEQDVEGRGIILADAAIQYMAEIFYPAQILAEVGATGFSGSGCELVYRFSEPSTGKEWVRAKTALVFFDYERRKPSPMPEAFLKKIGCSQEPHSGE